MNSSDKAIGMSHKYKLNNMGDQTDPCGSPLFNVFEIFISTKTLLLWVGQSQITSTRFFVSHRFPLYAPSVYTVRQPAVVINNLPINNPKAVRHDVTDNDLHTIRRTLQTMRSFCAALWIAGSTSPSMVR